MSAGIRGGRERRTVGVLRGILLRRVLENHFLLLAASHFAVEQFSSS